MKVFIIKIEIEYFLKTKFKNYEYLINFNIFLEKKFFSFYFDKYFFHL
jgi:hypothetical protein